MIAKKKVGHKNMSVADKLVDGLQDFAKALKKGAAIGENYNCHKVVLDLVPTPYDAKLVKATRSMLGASQAIFAQFLGVSIKAVRAWEQDINEPSEIACRFMDEIRQSPDHWKSRLRAAVQPKKGSRP